MRADSMTDPTPAALQRELDELHARFDSEENKQTGSLSVDRYFHQCSVITTQLKAVQAAQPSAATRAAPPARASQQAVPDAPEMAPKKKAQFQAFRSKFKEAHERDDLETMVSICEDDTFAELREENAEIAAKRIVRNLFRKSPGSAARLGLETVMAAFVREQHEVRFELAVHLTQLKKLLARIERLETRPELKWAGVYREGQEYTTQNVTTRDGSLWLAKSTTTGRPGASEDWVLIVKHGEKGKDAYALARDAGYRGTRDEWLESIGANKR
jgi:hypothetical protein